MQDYIAIDWGSSNLRAWFYQQGICQQSRQQAAGITQLHGRSPQKIFEHITAGWRNTPIPTFMAGMIGSNAGWQQTDYLPCPLAFSDIGRQLTPVLDAVWIIPGISLQHANNYNVMRGEETQLLGAHQLMPAHLYILPGTHCKWVQTSLRQIDGFRTVMTGELHHLLLNHSLIGAGAPAQSDDPHAFTQGLEQGLTDNIPQARLFEVRAARLLGHLSAQAVSEFLSGLLIGSEVRAMIHHYQPDRQQSITLIASEKLARRYQCALAQLGYQGQILSGEQAFQAGIRSIANAMAN